MRWILAATLAAAPAGAEPQGEDPLAVVCFGDAASHGASETGHVFPAALERFLLARDVACIVQDSQRSAETVAGALGRLDRDAFAREPDVIVWRFGQADGEPDASASSTFEEHLRLGLVELEQRGIQSLLVTPPLREGEPPSPVLAARIDSVRRLAALSGAALLDASETLVGPDVLGHVDPGRLSERGQELLAREVARRLVNLAPEPQRRSRPLLGERLQLVQDGRTTAAARERLPRLDDSSPEAFETGLWIGRGPFELAVEIDRSDAAGSGRLARMTVADDAAILFGAALGTDGELWGGPDISWTPPGSSGDLLRFTLRRRDLRQLELLLDGRSIWSGLWAEELGHVGFEQLGPHARLTGLHFAGSVLPLPTAPAPDPPTREVALEQDDLDVLDSWSIAPYAAEQLETMVDFGDGRRAVAALRRREPGSSTFHPLQLRTSRDGGRTWEPVDRAPAGLVSAEGNPALVHLEDRTGTERVVLWVDGYPVRTSTSLDGGRTWSELETAGPFGGRTRSEAVVATGRPGHALLFLWDAGRGLYGTDHGTIGPSRVHLTETRDGGITWSPPRPALQRTGRDLVRPTAFASPDGDRLLVLVVDTAGETLLAESTNAGRSWSELRPVAAELTGYDHAARLERDGSLLVFHRTQGPGQLVHHLWRGDVDDLTAGRAGRVHLDLLAPAACSGALRQDDGTWLLATRGASGSGFAAFRSEVLEATLADGPPR